VDIWATKEQIGTRAHPYELPLKDTWNLISMV